MIVVSFTDVHGKLAHMPAVAEEIRAADLVLLPGDLTMFGRRDKVIEVVESFREINPNLLAVMGNCDFPEVSEYLEEEGLFIHAGHKVVDGIAFVGLGGSLACPIPTLNEWSEEEVSEYLAEAVRDVPEDLPMVLVSHQPARDTAVDLAGHGQHVGSTAVREFIEARQPMLCLSGHIHEAIGEDRIGETRLVNPGPFMDGAWTRVEITDGKVARVEILRAA